MVNDELVEQLLAAYEQWIQGNPEPAVAMLSDDIAWIVPGNSAVSGTYNGIDEVMGHWKALGEQLRGLELQQVLSGGDYVAVSSMVTLTAGSAFQVDVWRFEDGKAIEFRVAADTALLESAFGSK
jgi:ketosteroid isomerase-like protein